MGAAWWIISDFLEDRRARRRLKERQELAARMHLEPREWKLEELKEFDGSDENKPILIGVDGEVFNVWRGRHFYGAEGPYNEFAGRDATRLLAKHIVDEKEDDGKALLSSELDELEGWKDLFRYKYQHVGTFGDKPKVDPPSDSNKDHANGF